MLILSSSRVQQNRVLTISKSSNLASNVRDRFLILFGTFLASLNHVLVQTLAFAERKRQGKQKDNFLNYNHTGNLCICTNPLKRRRIILLLGVQA